LPFHESSLDLIWNQAIREPSISLAGVVTEHFFLGGVWFVALDQALDPST